MERNEIVVDGVKYIRENVSNDIRIVILLRGFVYVGRFEQDGVNCVLRNAYNVRRWGTKAGLGELADSGPLENTVLDECSTVRFHELGVINQIDCSEKWENVV